RETAWRPGRRARAAHLAPQLDGQRCPHLRTRSPRAGVRAVPLPRSGGQSAHEPRAGPLREDGRAEGLRRAARTRVNLGLKGRVALVCGGTRGLGRAVADILEEEGAQVAINGRKDAPFPADVSDP